MTTMYDSWTCPTCGELLAQKAKQGERKLVIEVKPVPPLRRLSKYGGREYLLEEGQEVKHLFVFKTEYKSERVKEFDELCDDLTRRYPGSAIIELGPGEEFTVCELRRS